METIYEIQRIRQVISDVKGRETHIIRSPEAGTRVAAGFIGEDDREVFFVMCLNTKNRVVVVHQEVASMVTEDNVACRVITNIGDYQDSKHLHWHIVSGKLLR